MAYTSKRPGQIRITNMFNLKVLSLTGLVGWVFMWLNGGKLDR